MPVTAVKTKDKQGNDLRVQFMTVTPEEGRVHLDIYICNEEWIPTGTPEKKYLPENVSEETYHKALREEATKAAEFEPGYSSNPEWNPGYVEENGNPDMGQ